MDIKQKRIERILLEFKDLYTENYITNLEIKYIECDYKKR